MRTRRDETVHSQMISRMAEILRSQGYRDIRADVTGFKQPERAVTHLPDISAEGDKLYVFEVETSGSILHSHTMIEWPALELYAENRGGEFWVIVPQGNAEEAAARAAAIRCHPRIMEL